MSINSILFVIDSTWGEVEWMLPVLLQAKSLHPDWELHAAHAPNSKLALDGESVTNATMKTILAESAHSVVKMTSDDFAFPNIKEPENVKLLVLTNAVENPYKDHLIRRFPNAKIVIHPHGTAIIPQQRYNHPRRVNNWDKRYSKHDLYLLQTDLEIGWTFDRLSEAKVATIGFPPHDKWWIDKITQCPHVKNSFESKFTSQFKRRFVFFTRSKEWHFADDVCNYITQSVCDVVLSDPEACLMVKPHPKQNILELEQLLNQYCARHGQGRWMITNMHSQGLASLSDFVISVWSSCTLDTVVMGKPVVEFHRYTSPSEALVVDGNDRLQSFARLSGLAVKSESKEELASLVTNYFDPHADHRIWMNQQAAVKKYLLPEENCSLTAAKRMLSIIEPDSFQENKLPPIVRASSSLHGKGNVFLNDTNPISLNLALKRIKGPGSEISKQALSELQSFFEADTFIYTGSLCEQILSDAASCFSEVKCIETSPDLYQAEKFRELSSDRITVFNSAKILEKTLENLNDKNLLFWLSSHERFTLSCKSKTNAPVIHELSQIRDSGYSDSPIIISGLRYFQPSRKVHFEAQRTREYPYLADVKDELLKINSKYQLAVLGNIALAFIPNDRISCSMGVESLTQSMLHRERLPSPELNTAENYIALEMPQTERQAIQHLRDDWCSQEELSHGGIFAYWNALCKLGEKRFTEAILEFEHAIGLSYENWRVYYHMATIAVQLQQSELATNCIERVLQQVPEMREQAIALLLQLDGVTLANQDKA